MVSIASPNLYFEFKDYCISVPSVDKVDVLVRELLRESHKLENDSIIKVKLRKDQATLFNFFLSKDEKGQSFVVPCSIKKGSNSDLAELAPVKVMEGTSSRVYKAAKFSLEGDELRRVDVALLRNYSNRGACHLEVERNYHVLKYLHAGRVKQFLDTPGLLYRGRESDAIFTTQFTRVSPFYEQGDLFTAFIEKDGKSVSIRQQLKDVFSSVEIQLERGIYSADQKLENYLFDGKEAKGTDFGSALWFVPFGDGGKEFKEAFSEKNGWTPIKRNELLYTPGYSADSIELLCDELQKFHKKVFSDVAITKKEYESLKLRVEEEIVFQLACTTVYSFFQQTDEYFGEEVYEETQFFKVEKADDLKSKLASLGFKNPKIIIDALEDDPEDRPTFKQLKEAYDAFFSNDAISSK